MRGAAAAIFLLVAGWSLRDTTHPPEVDPPAVPAGTVTVTTQVWHEGRERQAKGMHADPAVASVSTAPTTTVPPVTTTLPEGLCSEWLADAIAVGWPVEEIGTVDYLIHRESRCDPSVINTEDPRGGSRGLLQINGHWCRPNPSYGIEDGWLQQLGIVSECDDLYDPHVNLQAALAIWLEYGFGPWGIN